MIFAGFGPTVARFGQGQRPGFVANERGFVEAMRRATLARGISGASTARATLRSQAVGGAPELPSSLDEAAYATCVTLREDALEVSRPGFARAAFVADLGGGDVLVSTSLRDLVEKLPEARTDLDELTDFVAGQAGGGTHERTMYRGVTRVRAQTRRTFGDRGARTESLPAPRPVELRADRLLADVVELLKAAVARSCGSASRIALPLSGGLDSSGVLAMLRELGHRPLVFTMDFEGTPDDRPHVAAIERFLGEPIVRFSPTELARHVPTLLTDLAQPTSLPNTAFELGCAEKARELGAEMWLTGLGGDDTLSGNMADYASELFEFPLRTVLGTLDMRVPWSISPRVRLQHWLVEPLFPRPLARLMARRRARIYRRFFPFAGSRLAAALRHYDEVHTNELPGVADPEARFAHVADARWVADGEESRQDVEALTGVPRSDPWMDGPLVASLARLPVSTLESCGLHRGLYRRALAGRIPESVRTRLDKGAADPFIATMMEAAGGFDLLAPYMDFGALSDTGIVEPRALASWIEGVRGTPRFFGSKPFWTLWRLVAAEAFLRKTPC